MFGFPSQMGLVKKHSNHESADQLKAFNFHANRAKCQR